MATKNKTLGTLACLRRTARHHYGNNAMSIIKFIYYSALRRNTFVVYGLDLNNPVRDHELSQAFRVLTPTPEELHTLRQDLDLPREFYYDKMHGVRTCYLAMSNGEIAYIHWVYVKGDPNRFLKLSEGVAELNYNTTLPKFRGKGLMGRMMAYIARDLQRKGYSKVVGVAHIANGPAIKNALWAGFKEIGRIKTMGPFNSTMKI